MTTRPRTETLPPTCEGELPLDPPRQPVLRRAVRPLSCRLTDAELLRLGAQLADALEAVATEHDRQDAVKQAVRERRVFLHA